MMHPAYWRAYWWFQVKRNEAERFLKRKRRVCDTCRNRTWNFENDTDLTCLDCCPF